MICKKCGAQIADTSKFCGYCGEVITESNENVQNVDLVNNENDLTVTMNADPIEFSLPVEPVLPVQPKVQDNLSSNIEAVSLEDKQLEPNNEVQQNEPITPNSTNSGNNNGNKKNNSIFILIGLILVVIAAALLVFAFKNSSSSISVLEKAIANFTSKDINSLTAVGNIELESAGQELSLGAFVKVESNNDDEAKLQFTLNIPMLFDEMSAFAEIDKEKATLYLESTLVDMLGYTSSDTPSWLYFTVELNEILDEMNLEDEETSDGDLNLDEIIDSKHFVKKESKDNLNHYQLIIDQELISSLKTKAERIGDNELKESIKELEESFKELKAPLKLDFYITDSNEFSKFEMDLTNQLTEEDEISKFVLSMELKDLNNTKVEIPSDALNSTVDLETYMSNNIVMPDYDIDYDYDYEYEF